jgi:hypothetical protein
MIYSSQIRRWGEMAIFRDKTKTFYRTLWSCRDCPNLSTPKKNVNYCLAAEKRLIENVDEFPDWCPLEE